MKLYWDMFQIEQTLLWGKISEFEKDMSKKTGIENLEFFFCDNECAGIGNLERTMKLIQRKELQ